MTTDLAPANNSAQDLSLLPPAQPIQANSFEQLKNTVEAMQLAARFATEMCKTTAVPDIYRIGSKQNSDRSPDEVIGNAAAAVLYGLELEISPTQALQNIFSVGGKPAIYARTAAALLARKGYRTWTESSTDEAVTVMGTSPDGLVTEASTWTLDRAKKAGYAPTIDEKTGEFRKNKWNKIIGNEKYLSDPQGMLYAKALMEVCRKLAPNLLMGIGDRDDAVVVEDEQSTPRRVPNEARPSSPGVDELRARLGRATSPDASLEVAKPEAPQSDDTQASAPEPETKKPTTAQNRKLSALFERGGLTKDDKNGRRIVFASFFPDRDLGAAPSADETDHVIGELEKIANSGDGDSVLVAFVEDVITNAEQVQQ
ncbi:hypothetical protein ACPXB3_22090 [Gordonia sp. DT219]|uniref:hypothetical protein n=1 Tax=Gordonia sp. DT219 TaxID=3416658 RepID=UPI003CE842D3